MFGVCFHKSAVRAWMPPSQGFLRRHRLFVLLKTLSVYCVSPIQPAFVGFCASPAAESERERGRETEGGDGARGNRVSRPGQAVGKEGSCRGKTQMSQDIPLWLHSVGQIQTFLQLFCGLVLELKPIWWVWCRDQHLHIRTDAGSETVLDSDFHIVVVMF